MTEAAGDRKLPRAAAQGNFQISSAAIVAPAIFVENTWIAEGDG